MHGSQEALGMLSPMDGAADKLLKGDLGGAGNEAMLEAFGGRVFKAAGKGMAAVKRHAGKLDEAVGALSHADDAATATATGVRESIEEASSVLAKEGGGVAANSAGNRFSRTQWQAPGGRGTGQNYTVYEQNIDWSLDVEGLTNMQRAMSGGAPYIMKNGVARKLNLHHSRQDARGALFEVSDVTHRARRDAGGRALHPYGRNQHPDYPVDRPAFDVDRNQYWIDRATAAGQ